MYGYSELIIFPLQRYIVIPSFLVVKGTFQGMVGLPNLVSSRKHTYISLTPLNPTFI